MSNPYKIYDKNLGPKWLKSLDPYINKTTSNVEARKRDTAVTKRNHVNQPENSPIDEASYVGPKTGMKGN